MRIKIDEFEKKKKKIQPLSYTDTTVLIAKGISKKISPKTSDSTSLEMMLNGGLHWHKTSLK